MGMKSNGILQLKSNGIKQPVRNIENIWKYALNWTWYLISIFIVEPFSKKCCIYCNKRYECIEYAASRKGLQ